MSKRARARDDSSDDEETTDVIFSDRQQLCSTPSKRVKMASSLSNREPDTTFAKTRLELSNSTSEFSLTSVLDPLTTQLPKPEDIDPKSNELHIPTDRVEVETTMSDSGTDITDPEFNSDANLDSDFDSTSNSGSDSDSDYVDDDANTHHPVDCEALDILDAEDNLHADHYITLEEGLDQLLSESDREGHEDEDEEDRIERKIMRSEERDHAELVADEGEMYEDILSWA